MTDFALELSRGLAHVTKSFPRPATCPPPTPAVLPPEVTMAAQPQTTGSLTKRMLQRLMGVPIGGGKGGKGGGGKGGGGKGGGGRRLAGGGNSAAGISIEGSGFKSGASTGLRVAVCIAGQLSRLEIHSKVENVLKPTEATSPAALDVFLALEVGKTLYSNLDFGAILAQQHASCGASALTTESATAQLSPWLAAARFSNHTTRAIDLSQWRRYRKDRPTVERTTRLQHHLSQFAHMRTCAQLIEAQEVKHSWHYDVVLKMRDNTIAVSPFVVTNRHAAGRTRTKRCVEWGGYNDKAMIVPRRYMDGALRAPSEDFFLARDIGRGIPNSERLLRAVLDRNGVLVSRVEPEDLPLVDGRCSPFGWCLVEQGKDCRPQRWSYPCKPCEELNATATQRALYDKRFKPRAAIAADMRSTVGVGMNEA